MKFQQNAGNFSLFNTLKMITPFHFDCFLYFQSLGRMLSGPLYDDENEKVVLEFEGGDYCAAHPTMRMTATIILSCLKGPDQVGG